MNKKLLVPVGLALILGLIFLAHKSPKLQKGCKDYPGTPWDAAPLLMPFEDGYFFKPVGDNPNTWHIDVNLRIFEDRPEKIFLALPDCEGLVFSRSRVRHRSNSWSGRTERGNLITLTKGTSSLLGRAYMDNTGYELSGKAPQHLMNRFYPDPDRIDD